MGRRDRAVSHSGRESDLERTGTFGAGDGFIWKGLAFFRYFYLSPMPMRSPTCLELALSIRDPEVSRARFSLNFPT